MTLPIMDMSYRGRGRYNRRFRTLVKRGKIIFKDARLAILNFNNATLEANSFTISLREALPNIKFT